ncbi:MAG: NUDIX domain-containing protein [archaeon]|nr:NUDIX domain-containing protein [archaeon]
MVVKQLVAFLLFDDWKILAEVRKSTDDFGAGAVWIPGGHIEENETSEQAMFREMKEELGITPLKFFALCKLPWKKDNKDYSIDYFVCTEWAGEIKNKEASQLIWISENEINKLDEEVDKKAFTKCLKF